MKRSVLTISQGFKDDERFRELFQELSFATACNNSAVIQVSIAELIEPYIDVTLDISNTNPTEWVSIELHDNGSVQTLVTIHSVDIPKDDLTP